MLNWVRLLVLESWGESTWDDVCHTDFFGSIGAIIC
jgi:hypothetical protein